MDTYVNNSKETSFRPSSIGSDLRGTDGRTDERSGGRSFVRTVRPTFLSLSPLLLLLLLRRRRPSLDPNLAKKTHLKRGGGGQKSQAALTQDGVNSRARAHSLVARQSVFQVSISNKMRGERGK